ncbi:MAG: D-alanyl-D-alanine carboxypeptidase [Lachnospiraceae bacterium]|nr:D-alanyl-D-alanine carboxypeptidase [Lachnospiraceae bacterium]
MSFYTDNNDIDYEHDSFELRRQKRAQRRAERERQRRLKRIRVCVSFAGVVAFVLLCALSSFLIIQKNKGGSDKADRAGTVQVSAQAAVAEGNQVLGLSAPSVPDTVSKVMVEVETPVSVGADDTELEEEDFIPLSVEPDDNTVGVSDEVVSEYVILVSLSENRVVAARNCRQLMYPASMTKVLTILTAADHMESDSELDSIFEITNEIEAFSYENGCSNVGFTPGERVTVRDLFYGTILPSGADAAMALAEYTAGSQEVFVDMMNEKAAELGISESSHFTNCIGIYDDDHYSTASDMAVIMDAAMKNPICADALSRHTYTTTPTSYHPDGIMVSNWFLRRIEDKQETGLVVGAKTGFVNQSRNCAVSYAVSDEGEPFICVTGASSSSWRCIYDHVDIYTNTAFK